MAADTGISGALTDGDGIGAFTVPKIVKDLIADALLSASAALIAAGIGAIPADGAQASVAAFAIGGALIHALYRTVLKWAQT